jgi:hypothetical protein
MKSDALALSTGLCTRHQGFDKLSPNGWTGASAPPSPPLALSLSKGPRAQHQGFDKLSPNGAWSWCSAREATKPGLRNASQGSAP